MEVNQGKLMGEVIENRREFSVINVSWVQCSLSDFSRLSHLLSKLDLCEGGSFSPTIFNIDIELFSTFRFINVSWVQCSLSDFSRLSHLLSKLDLCEGGSFSPTIFNIDIELFSTFRFINVSWVQCSLSDFSRLSHLLSKLDLCEGGSFSPTIFNIDIELFSTFRFLYLFVTLPKTMYAENLHIVLSSPKAFIFNLLCVLIYSLTQFDMQFAADDFYSFMLRFESFGFVCLSGRVDEHQQSH